MSVTAQPDNARVIAKKMGKKNALNLRTQSIFIMCHLLFGTALVDGLKYLTNDYTSNTV